jgi:hypothetical protein
MAFSSASQWSSKVHLEHRGLEQYGEQAEMMRSIFDSEGGWTGILQRFANAATSAELEQEALCPSGNKWSSPAEPRI